MVLVEKYKKPDYIDEGGTSTWLDRYGSIAKQIDKDGHRVVKLEVEVNLDMRRLFEHGIDYQFEFENSIRQQLMSELEKKGINPDSVQIGRMTFDILDTNIIANTIIDDDKN